MQPLPEEEFKTKDPELQRWLSSVLAKQQADSQRNLLEAHEQLRVYLDARLQEIIAASEGYGDKADFNLGDVEVDFVKTAQRDEPRYDPDLPPMADFPPNPTVLTGVLGFTDEQLIQIDDEENELRKDGGGQWHSEPPPLQKVNDSYSSYCSSGVMARIRAQGLRNTMAMGTISGASQNTGRCIDWLMGEPMDIAAATAIFASTFVFFMQLQWKGYLCRVAMGLDEAGGWAGATKAFANLEFMFAALFLTELILRLSYFRMTFFKDGMNCMDCVVVVVCSFDTFLFSQIEGVGGGNLVFTRMIRYAKLVRTLRFIRAMKLCSPLRILIRTIASSFMSLVWSMVILMVMMLMSGLFICQTLQEYIVDTSAPWEHRVWVEKNYGNAAKALWTMFEITFSGGWPTWVSPLVEYVSVWYAVFFAAYVGGVVFAVIRIITALFLKDTLAVAANDNDMMVQQKAKDRAKFVGKLEEIFREFDTNQNGMISFDEFQAFVKNPASKVYISQLELEAHELEGLFTLLDDGDDQVSFDEFLSGVIRLRGQTRTHDVLVLLHDMRKISQNVKRMCEEMRMMKLHIRQSGNGSADTKRPGMVL